MSLLSRGVTAIAIVALLIPGAFAVEPTSNDASFTRETTALVERSEREDGFSGVILVARGDKILLRKAAGFADRSRNVRNNPETPFPIESVTKQFTATAIMLLVEDRKIALDDPISNYYPAAPGEWAGITIKHLLTHSSGIGDQWFTDANIEKTAQYQKDHSDIIPLVSSAPLLFQPGAGFQYSNAGYMLLAGVIERASGTPYAKFLTDRIFVPLGMKNTDLHVRPSLKGYIRAQDGVLQDARLFDKPGGPNGAGGIYSTVDDMLIWSRAWDEGRILSATSRAAALTDYGHNYGFGWRFAPKFGRDLVWHTGNFGPAGFASIFDRFPQEKLAFVVLTNALGPTGSTATLQIEGKETTFPANAARKLVEAVETLYFRQDLSGQRHP